MEDTDIKFCLPEFISDSDQAKVGGTNSDVEITPISELVENETQLFVFAVRYDNSTYKQFQKIFIKNINPDEILQNVRLYGYNNNGNGIVTMAVEVGDDKEMIKNGEECVKNFYTEPDLHGSYNFQEYNYGSPLEVPDLEPYESIGIWLKLEFSSIDAFQYDDLFTFGVRFSNSEASSGSSGSSGSSDGSSEYNNEIDLKHQRVDGNCDIIKWESPRYNPLGIDIYFNRIDMTLFGRGANSDVYGVYVDRIFYRYVYGRNSVSIRRKNVTVPIYTEVVLLPDYNYKPDLGNVPSDYRNRFKIVWESKNPNLFDEFLHKLYWDNKTGTYLDAVYAKVNAKTGVGGGKIETSKILTLED